ncbi:MAG: pyridoxamine 5'-phosphate oxidase family protein [Hyphomicrobiales bacterium]|jgi:PPOX class probable FMN-dependent enzyme|nr:pyridoxamine 5'-phosphate oxidase family protein [Hyphomicrobiales bacterium]|tara:strand:+ start:465 stop:1067 length:603 start_codon:yes stop_codon:yes gene_type:complete
MTKKNEINIDKLKQLYTEPKPTSIAKVQYKIDHYCKEFISKSPFLILGTEGDVSPKGDFPGFVEVIDEKTIAIPDRSGNNRLDSYINILSNPTVAVMFLIPGISETLRIRGVAEITTDSKLLETMSVNVQVPKTALIVHIKEIYLHCAKAIVRSGIWDPKNKVKDYSTREMFAQHVGKKINEFSEYYDDSIETVLDDEGR